MYSFPNSTFPVYYFALRAFLIVLSFYLLLQLFDKYIKHISSKGKQAIASAILIFLFFFYTAELLLTFYPETNGLNDTYCSKNWMYYYWKQNKQKFRDVDFEKLADIDKPAIVFTGDSYTEGHGIKHPEDRVSDRLRKAFPQYTIYNAGKCGWDIRQEKSLIKQLPVKPKIIFLQICSNDWDYLVNNSSYIQAKQTALFADMDFSVSNYSILFNYLKSKSGLLMQNYFGYRLSEEQKKQMTDRFRLYDSAEKLPANPFKAFEYCLSKTTLSDDSIQDVVFSLFKGYDPSLELMLNPVSFESYLFQLEDIQRICTSRKIKLVVIPYPSLNDFSMNVTSKYINRYLCNLIEQRGITCLNIYPVLKKANLKRYTVNSSDNHINKEASRVVADELTSYLRLYQQELQ
ncbi:MAG: SGNH/GDSL hydrolase family protein [Sphingobacteriales bacterium]|nr:SGNH/GDSL hydrolase family protein [Sphingobacteriales bacterium]